MDWKQLGNVAPRSLQDARLQTHWAAQVVASVGRAHGVPREDDSHRNLGWDEANVALTGHVIRGSSPFQPALRPATLELLVLDDAGGEIDRLALDGRRLEDAFTWMREAIARHTGVDRELERPEYELPSHAVAESERFDASSAAAFEEIARWYANANSALGEVVRKNDGASDVRCWPHHFDIATLILVEQGEDAERSRTIGVGMTPGDGGYPEPYWYVTPWPYPADPQPGDVPDGHWHTEGWFGAVQTGTVTVAPRDAGSQRERVGRFLERAIAQSMVLLAAAKETR